MIFRDIKGYEGEYEVSEHGLIYSKKTDREMKLLKHNAGYFGITLTKNGKQKRHYVHRLVYEAFHGELKEGFVVDHIDHDPTNNHFTNLQQVSKRENRAKDAWRRNPKSQYPGVARSGNKWKTLIRIKGVQHHAGTFDTEAEAYKAYKEIAEDNSRVYKYRTKSSKKMKEYIK